MSELKLAQENELRVLSSMYTTALKDLRTKKDKRSKPPDFRLTLAPSRSNSVIIQLHDDPTIDLHVQETPLYPHEAPILMLKNPKNLSNDVVQRLQKEIDLEVMIYELAQIIETSLGEYRPKKRTSSSQSQQQQIECSSNLGNEVDDGIEREIHVTREKYSEERKRRYRERQNSEPSTVLSKTFEYYRSSSELIIKFENHIKLTVRRGKILYTELHPTLNDYVLHTVYFCTDIDCACAYCLYEWNFEYSLGKLDDDLGAQYRREIGNLENDLKHLISLKHIVLCKIIAYETVIDTPTYTFRVLTECPEASSLEVFDTCPVAEAFLKKIAISLTEVLTYLHSKSVVHREIKSKSIFLLPSGFKLTRTSFVRRLNELHLLFHEGKAPRSLHGSIKNEKINDIYDMGLLLLNLATGRTYEYILDAPDDLSDNLRDFLQSCSNGDSLKSLALAPFLLHTSDSRTDFHRLISDSEGHDGTYSGSINNDDNILVSAQSRLKSDFEVLGIVGTGGFGHVFKIVLKSAHKHLNKKITREVKLLSKLNHQNIVRYYSTWTEEISFENDKVGRSSPSKSGTSTRTSSKPKNIKRLISHNDDDDDSLRKELLMSRNNLGLANTDNTNYDKNVKGDNFENNDTNSSMSSESSSTSSDDESGVFDTRTFHALNVSDGLVIFDHNASGNGDHSEPADIQNVSSSSSSTNGKGKKLQRVLFIQMEYCEGNTLKQLIDRRLLQEKPNMVWMLLREILEGLNHMHEKGIIHRDLKPGNVLLDSKGHAKIGDLGLATITKLSAYVEVSDKHQTLEHSLSIGEAGLLSSPVGTAFYIAPELLNGPKTIPTEKVDIYSLGITFFEMCYPFDTLMERAKILKELRRSDIIVPEHFHQKPFEKHYELLQQMLSHEPDKRPSAKSLLQSNITQFEQEEQFKTLLERMLNDQQSFQYRKTIEKLFEQKNSIIRDATFDPDTQVDTNRLATFHRDSNAYTSVRNTFIRVFEKYGAFFIRLPLMLPDTQLYDKGICSNLKFVSSSGLLLTLPFDSKVPLSRYIARCVSHYGLNNLTTMKCYQIGSVYRETVAEMHPREITECGFDILFTGNTFLPDAEILAVCQDVLLEFHLVQQRNLIICLSHSQLLKAILKYYDVPIEKVDKIISLLTSSTKDRLDSLNSIITECGINEQIAKKLQSLLVIDGPFEKVILDLKKLTKATREIRLTVRFVALNPILNINAFSGFIFQVVCVSQKKRHSVSEIYAGGGRYDSLLEHFRRPSQKSHPLPHMVGVSFDMERMIHLNSTLPAAVRTIHGKTCDTAICLDYNPVELLRLRQDLISIGVGVDTIYELPSYLENLDDYCIASSYNYLIYTRNESVDDYFRFRIYENKKFFSDKRMNNYEIMQHYHSKHLYNNNTSSGNNNSASNSLNSIVDNESSTLLQSVTGSLKNVPPLSSLFVQNEQQANGAQINIMLYYEQNPKLINKKKIENQVQYKLSHILPLFTSKSRIEVFVFDLTDVVLMTFITTLNIEDETSYSQSLRLLIEKLPKLGEMLTRFGEQLKELRFGRTKSKLFVISSVKSDFYRLMVAFS
ncbi:unnamed protein product [Didymodactylos carnosus]|uniref:non-specific serine/threonine protein kinase n=1 Tax=Didymodactylos carnosus TaxID=1234261 RepID=A0A813RL90_9BILA|nr:unnamed protein product [Didymodactylos carnosus]CAF3566088.1 unnamed protein product [Didymodactylos carnosus]